MTIRGFTGIQFTIKWRGLRCLVFCDKSFKLRFEGRERALKLRFVSLEVSGGLLLNLVDLKAWNKETRPRVD